MTIDDLVCELENLMKEVTRNSLTSDQRNELLNAIGEVASSIDFRTFGKLGAEEIRARINQMVCEAEKSVGASDNYFAILKAISSCAEGTSKAVKI